MCQPSVRAIQTHIILLVGEKVNSARTSSAEKSTADELETWSRVSQSGIHLNSPWKGACGLFN